MLLPYIILTYFHSARNWKRGSIAVLVIPPPMPHAAKIFVDLMWYRHAVPTDIDEEKVDHEIIVQLDKLRADNWNLGPKVLTLP